MKLRNNLLNLDLNKICNYLIQSPYLQSGDIVGLLSTARSFTKKEVQPFIDLLSTWGLKVKIGNTADKKYHQF